MKTIFAACIPLLLSAIAAADQPRLTKEQAAKVALLVLGQPKYRKWTSWFGRVQCEALSYDREKRLWAVPSPSFVISYGAGGPPFFEIRDTDCYYRMGPGDQRDKTKFQMSPGLKKQIEAIVAVDPPINGPPNKP